MYKINLFSANKILFDKILFDFSFEGKSSGNFCRSITSAAYLYFCIGSDACHFKCDNSSLRSHTGNEQIPFFLLYEYI
jgi:hypothetical protein